MPWSCVSHSHLLAISGIKLLGQNFNPRYPRADQVGPYLERMRTECIATVAAAAYAMVEDLP